jgi:hypothetical protein
MVLACMNRIRPLPFFVGLMAASRVVLLLLPALARDQDYHLVNATRRNYREI